MCACAFACARPVSPRWVHATCQGLSCEEEVEAVADEGFDCSLCQSPGRASYGEQRAGAAHAAPGSHSLLTSPASVICCYEMDGEMKKGGLHTLC